MAVPVPQPSRRSGREFKVPDRLGAPLNITDFDEDEEEVVEGDDAESSSEYGNTFKKPKKAPRRKAKKRAASQQQMMVRSVYLLKPLLLILNRFPPEVLNASPRHQALLKKRALKAKKLPPKETLGN